MHPAPVGQGDIEPPSPKLHKSPLFQSPACNRSNSTHPPENLNTLQLRWRLTRDTETESLELCLPQQVPESYFSDRQRISKSHQVHRDHILGLATPATTHPIDALE